MSIITVGYSVLVFTISCFGIRWYKSLTTPFRILTWSVIMIFFMSLSSDFFIFKYKTNAPVLQVQCVAEFIFYSTIYYQLFKNETIKRAILIIIIAAIVFFPINAIFLQPFYRTFPTNINTPAQVLYAIFSLLLFKEMLDYPLQMNIVKQSIFWFNTAMLFYATTIFFMLGISNYLSERGFEDKIVTDLWWFIDYIFEILIGIALLTYSKEPDRGTS